MVFDYKGRHGTFADLLWHSWEIKNNLAVL